MKNASSGIGITGLLQVAFIVLKLCKVINWSWWLVFMPTFVDLGAFVIILLISIVVSIIKDRY
jgi:hypothetical protein